MQENDEHLNFEEQYEDEMSSEISAMFHGWENSSECEDEEIGSYVNEKVVCGMYENEIELEQLNTADSFTPMEIEEHLESYFRFFSKSDMDLIYMNFIGDKTQIDLQEIFHKTQPAISCTSDRIKEQIGVIIKIQNVIDEFIYFITDTRVKLTNRDRNILLVFFYSTSIVKTAQIIGVNPMICRTRIDSALTHLIEGGHTKIYNYFKFILDNLNKVKKDVTEEIASKKPGKYDYASGHVSQELPFS